MSYSDTLQVKNNPSNDRLVCNTTSQEKLYEHELMYFVYKKVLEASEQKPKELGNKLDLDSVSVILSAHRAVLEHIGRGSLN